MFNWIYSEKLKKEFESRIIEHIDSIYTTALSMTRNKEDAEDLVQDTTLRAYRFFYKFKTGTNFKAWIMTILRNLYINEYRKKIKEPATLSLDESEELINSTSLSEINDNQEEIFNEPIKTSIDKLLS